MTQRDQFGGLLRTGDSGDARGGEDISLGHAVGADEANYLGGRDEFAGSDGDTRRPRPWR